MAGHACFAPGSTRRCTGRPADLQTADRRDQTGAVRPVLRRERGEVTDEITGLLLLEEQAANVGRLALELGRYARVVDDRELRLREPLRDLRDRVGHQEPDPDHELIAVAHRASQVRHVVGARLRDEDTAVDPSSRFASEPLVREEVERAVVETADVGHESDLERRLLRLRRGSDVRLGRSVPATASVKTATKAAATSGMKIRPFTYPP